MALRTYTTGFVARGRELARLDAALAAVIDGAPRCVLIGGEAGVGKTRLVSEFAGRAHQAGMRVLAGGCVDVSGGLPYGPISEAFRGLERDLGNSGLLELLGADHTELQRFLPGGAETAAGAGVSGRLVQGRLFELLMRLLYRLGEATPVILVVEDLHWADRSTLDLLAFLSSNLREERLLLIATYRSDQVPVPALNVFRAEFGRLAERVDLSRFGHQEFAAFLATILGARPPGAIIDQLFALSDGNPFFAEELVAAGLDSAGTRLPPGLRDILLARAQVLSAEVQDTLRVAATIGRRVDHPLLATVSELDERALLRALREAVTHQILVADPDGTYVFRHALTREAVYGDLLPGERMHLHGRVARALEQDPDRAANGASAAAELAHHWNEAGDLPRTLSASVAAARAASEAAAFAAAERQYERALTLWERVGADDRPTGLDQAGLLQEAAETARWTGDAQRAVTLVERALALVNPAVDPGRVGALQERLGLYLWEAGEGRRSLAAYERATQLLPEQPPSAARAQVLAAHGATLMLSSRYHEAQAQCLEAIRMARAVGAHGPETHALNTLGFAVAMLGDPDEGVDLLEESRRIAEQTNDVDAICRAYTNLSTVLALVGRLTAAIEVAERGTALTRRLGVELSGGAVLLGMEAFILFRLGRWDEAEDLSRELLSRPVPQGLILFAHTTQVELHTARGELDQGRDSLAAARRSATGVTDPLVLGHLHAAAAELALWHRNLPAAAEAVNEGIRTVAGTEEDQLLLRLCGLGLRLQADRAERVPPRRAAAELPAIQAAAGSLLARAERAAARPSGLFPEARAHLLACRAELSRLADRPDPAAWAAAAAAWADLGFPFSTARARWWQAEALLHAHAQAKATEALREAYRLADALGAIRLCDEIQLLAARGRLDLRPPRAPEQPPAAEPSPADAFRLTAREREVLRHVAVGSTNRQIARGLFISEKTASVHVSNIIRKLGVSNRGEAADLAHRLDMVDLPLPLR